MATKTFEAAKQVLTLRPLGVINRSAFIFKSMADLKNLVLFVGRRPAIDEDSNLWFKNMKVVPNSVVLRDAFGNVIAVLTLEQAAKEYEIITDEAWKPEHANVIAEAPKTEKGKRGGITRAEIVEILKKNSIAFDARASKSVLEEVMNQSVKK